MSDEEPKKPLTPALQNPWYHLLTWYGEPEGLGDEIAKRNWIFWHSYILDELGDDHKNWLIEKKIPWYSEIQSFSEVEKLEIITELKNRLVRNGVSSDILSLMEWNINLSNIEFKNNLFLENYFFPDEVVFENSHFFGYVGFTDSFFSKEVYFQGSVFFGLSNFEGTLFSGSAHFNESEFQTIVFLGGAKFLGTVDFQSAIFSSLVSFNNVKFESDISFEDACFTNETVFVLAEFSGEFSANGTTYKILPYFSSLDGIIHPISLLNSIDHFIRLHNIVDQIGNSEVQYYENTFSALKNKAIEVQKDRFALNIWALELQLERKLLKQKDKKDLRDRLNIFAISAYESTADFGRSFVYPFYALLGLMIIGLLVQLGLQYLFYSPIGFEWQESLKTVTSISVSNTFLFLTPWKVEGLAMMNGWVKFFSLVQSVFSFAFIFLIGLGLRNRFKIR